MPCHCENDVIYMEEAYGDPSKATRGVNATDIQGTGARFPFGPAAPCPAMLSATNSDEPTGNLTVTAKVPPIGEQFFKYLRGL